MEGRWTRRYILIWGKTRPEISKTYREIVCTGGVFRDTKRLVRLYPIPLRYMDDERVFKKYQWIEAFVTKAADDPRPESHRIRADNISVGQHIPTRAGNWDERARWIINDQNVFPSVEELKTRQAKDNTSLGLVKPKLVSGIQTERFGREERESFWTRYKALVAQMDLPLDTETGREVKPLFPPDYRWKIRFHCYDESCRGHEFSVLDWELDALYFGLKRRGQPPNIAAKRVQEKLEETCGPDRDLYLFLGNISTHPRMFTIVGLWYPKKKGEPVQQSLL